MEFRFASKELASLDDLDMEVLACPVWSDKRPVHGVAGLCDFRLLGRISDLLRRGMITGALGEQVLLPGKPRLTFDKLILFGAGPYSGFQETTFQSIVERILHTMQGLAARTAVVELPGRGEGLISAETAADILLSAAGRGHAHDTWILVEDADGRQRITQFVADAKRRVRRVLSE